MNLETKRHPGDHGKSVTNPLASLRDYGQAAWLDFLARDFIAEGGLKKLVQHDGLTGVTSNPSIFEKAIAGSAEYDSSLRKIEAEGDFDVMKLYERLAIEDIQHAADELRPVFEATKRADGYVSLEVSPYLAMSTEATVAEARRLWGSVGREIAVIGDGGNDISMFERSGLSIAMGNGGSQVQGAADFVTDPNNQDGFPKAIERYVLGGHRLNAPAPRPAAGGRIR